MLLQSLVSTHLLAIIGNLDDGEELNDTKLHEASWQKTKLKKLQMGFTFSSRARIWEIRPSMQNAGRTTSP
jgi:hypothetical protein